MVGRALSSLAGAAGTIAVRGTPAFPIGRTGLGLCVCHIVKDYGGDIRLDTIPGEGATFTMLPPAETTSSTPAEEEVADPPVPGAGERVLVVDDEDVVRLFMMEALRRNGFSADGAANGQEALDKVRAASYDLIVLDLRMPVMSGQEFFRRLQESRPELAKRVFFITGDAISESTVQFLRSSGQPWEGKPVRVPDLLAALRRFLDTLGGERQGAP